MDDERLPVELEARGLVRTITVTPRSPHEARSVDVAVGPLPDAALLQELVADGTVVILAPTHEAPHRAADPATQHDRGLMDVPERLRVGLLSVDLKAHEARWKGRRLCLTDRELRLLATLMCRPGRTWTFAELSLAVWNYDSSNRWELRSAIKRLRRKLADADVDSSIEAVRAVGFRWTPGQDVGRRSSRCPSNVTSSCRLSSTYTRS